MRRPTRLAVLQASGWALALAVLASGFHRVYTLERGEIDFESPPRSLAEARREPDATRRSARLASVELAAHHHVTFELCAAEALDPGRFEGAFELLILHLQQGELMLRVPLDRDHLERARGNASGACLLLGRGVLEHAGTYTVDAVFGETGVPPAIADVPLRVRILAKHPLTPADRARVGLLGVLVLVLVALQLYAAPPAIPVAADGVHSFTWADINVDPIAALLACLVLFGASIVPLSGPTLTLVKGLALLALQIALALAFTRAPSRMGYRQKLALCRPSRALLPVLGATAALPVLVGTAMLALRLLPSTGEAPIETFVSWPSGMLAAALLGVILPLGEEVFFRGYLYGALLSYGKFWSAAANVIVFGSLHALQGWGNWGGLFGVFAAGLVFLGLRIASGSVLVATLLHVAYNLTLTWSSLRAAG